MTTDHSATDLPAYDRAQLENDRLERQRRRQLANKQLKAETWTSESSRAYSITTAPRPSALVGSYSAIPTHQYSPSVDSSTDSGESEDTPSTKPSHLPYWKHYQTRLSANHQHPEVPALEMSSLVAPTVVLNSLGNPASSASSANLSLAIVSAPAVDAAWLMQYIPPEKVPAILVTASNKLYDSASSDPAFSSEAGLKFLGSNWVQCRPEVGGSGLMRANYMLLFYGTSMLRVMITSAHFTEFHWTAVDNLIWVQDFPIRLDTSTPLPPLAKRFASTLLDVMSWQDIPTALLSLSSVGLVPNLNSRTVSSLLACYDFSAVSVALVASIPGKHDGWPAAQKVGHTGLMSAVNDINGKCPAECTLSIEYLTSSLGLYTPQWLRQFQNSAEGGDQHHSFLKMPSKFRQKIPFPDISSLKIIFPSRSTAGSSDNGVEFLPGNNCSSRCWASPGFPKHLLFDGKPKASGLSTHSKMIIAAFRNGLFPGTASTAPYSEAKCGGWCYLGSHDLTAAAWGEWLPTSTWFTPSLKMSHCALGVVIPLGVEDVQSVVDDVACFQRPAPPYRETDVPWVLY